jgi:hypothetical protein
MLYRHKKGGVYLKLLDAVHTETLEKVTVYLHLWPHKIGFWARPKTMFDEPGRFKRIF